MGTGGIRLCTSGTPLTHAAEQGASTPLLTALSGHTFTRSLARSARDSAEAL
jgi:integrase/recombinase XerC/integrase/recombinase XerD